MSARRLPAFAWQIAEARKRGMRPRNPTVSVALHWRHRPRTGYGVLVPDGTDPAALDWSFVHGLEVMLWRYGDDPARVRAAAGAIRAARPHRLLILDISSEEGEPSRIINVVRPETDHARTVAA